MSSRRDQEIIHDRVSELQEQNAYLHQKCNLLEQKYHRNEHERADLLKRNEQLEEMKVHLEQQLQVAIGTVKRFVEFRQDLEYEESMWERRSNPKYANTTETNVIH
jgi:predicted RNA-binding protein YlxR (DUF448 family)